MFITIEGVIGVGNTSATRLLAEAFAEPESDRGDMPVLTIDTTNLDLVGSSQDKQGFIDRVGQALLAGAGACHGVGAVSKFA